ncbi:hypothetical protein HK436_24985 [Mesorhizobium sediminum]|nr:hypothetical protein [Mesorhizobium sediminum]
MAVAKAQALVPGLVVVDADPAGDDDGLHKLALWALQRISPVVAPDPSDGLVIDTTGADHLHGGEALMRQRPRLRRAGDDRLFGEEGDDILHGEAGDDLLSGGAGRDMLYGGDGDDVLQGDDGDDYLDGGDGNDRIDGGARNDILSDGDGADLVFGGTGDDVVFAAMDGADDVYDGGCDYDTVEASISELKFAMETERATCEFGSPGGGARGCSHRARGRRARLFGRQRDFADRPRRRSGQRHRNRLRHDHGLRDRDRRIGR